MEDKAVKKLGRPKNIHTPIKHFSEEDRKQAIIQSKTKYMVNKIWICNFCDYDYKLAGKTAHCKTKKHIRNIISNNINRKLDIIR